MSQSGQRSKSCLSNNSKTTEANLTKLHRKIKHYDKVFHAQELDSYAQGQGSLAVFKVTARDQVHYKGHLGAFVTYCNISCFILKKRPPYTDRAHETWFKYIPPLDDVQRINKSVTPPSILRSSFEFVVMKILSAL